MNKVIAWLAAEMETEHLRTVDPDVAVEPMERARRTARAQAFTEAVRCLRLSRRVAPEGAEQLTVLLADPHDALVVEILRAFTHWGLERVLPDLVVLRRALDEADRPAVREAVDACLASIAPGAAVLGDDQSRSISSRTERRASAARPTRWIASTNAAVRSSTPFCCAVSRTAP